MTEGGFSVLVTEVLFVVALIVAWNSGALVMAVEWLAAVKVGQ